MLRRLTRPTFEWMKEMKMKYKIHHEQDRFVARHNTASMLKGYFKEVENYGNKKFKASNGRLVLSPFIYKKTIWRENYGFTYVFTLEKEHEEFELLKQVLTDGGRIKNVIFEEGDEDEC